MSTRKAWADYTSEDDDSDQDGFFAKYEPSAQQAAAPAGGGPRSGSNQRPQEVAPVLAAAQQQPPTSSRRTVGLAAAKRQLQVRDSQDSYSYQRKADCLEADLELEGRLNGTALNFEGVEEKFERGERLEVKVGDQAAAQKRSKSSSSSSSTKVPGGGGENNKEVAEQVQKVRGATAKENSSASSSKTRGVMNQNHGNNGVGGGGRPDIKSGAAAAATKGGGRSSGSSFSKEKGAAAAALGKGGKNARSGGSTKGGGKAKRASPGGPGPGRIPLPSSSAPGAGAVDKENGELSPGQLMQRISNSSWKGWGTTGSPEADEAVVHPEDEVNENDALDLRASLSLASSAPDTRKARVKMGRVDFNKGKTIAIGHTSYEKPGKAERAAAGGRTETSGVGGVRPGVDVEGSPAAETSAGASKGGKTNTKGSKGKGKGKGASADRGDGDHDVEMASDEREDSPEPRKFEERAAPTDWAAALNKTLTDADKAKSRALQTKVPKFESTLNPHAPAYVPGFGALGTQVTMVQTGHGSLGPAGQAFPFFGAALLAKSTSVPSSATSVTLTAAQNGSTNMNPTAGGPGPPSIAGGIKRARDVALTPASSARAGYFDKMQRTSEAVSGIQTPNSDAMGSEMTGISQVTTDSRSMVVTAPYIVGMVGQVYVDKAKFAGGSSSSSKSRSRGAGGLVNKQDPNAANKPDPSGSTAAAALTLSHGTGAGTSFAPAQRKKLNLAAIDMGTAAASSSSPGSGPGRAEGGTEGPPEQQGSTSASSATSSTSSSSGTREAKANSSSEIGNLTDQIMGDGKGHGGEARLPQEPELDAEALQKRQKKVDKMKSWPCYQQYLAKVPKEARTKDQPSTPSCTDSSARNFRYEIERFRRWLADNHGEEVQ